MRTASSAPLTAVDDRGHALGDDPRARESLLWNVLAPDDDVFVILYVTRKAEPLATVIALSFSDGEPPVVEIVPETAFVGDDLAAFRAAGLTVRHGEPLRGVDAAYAGQRIAVDLRFAGLHEPFDYLRNADGCVPAAATNRFEQAGAISGEVRVDDRAVAFATTGHRDHSWGVRDYPALHHHVWIYAQAGPGVAVHAMHTWWRGRQYTNGFVLKDGELAGVTDMRVDWEYDADLLQRGGTLRIDDDRGRRTVATGVRFAGGFVSLGDVVLAEAGCRFTIDGRDGVGVLEQGWRPEYLEHFRATRGG